MNLTQHQQDRLKTCLNILRDGDRILIRGLAGTGKTTLCKALIENLLPFTNGKYITCTAPTNKAVSVLRSKVIPMNRTTFISTHASLKMKRFIDEKTGKIFFEPNFHPKEPPLKNVYALIIDEASMINKNLLRHIEEWATIQKCKVIFLMDYHQLPPVNEVEMPVHTMGYPDVELTEIIRQKENNPIINISLNLNLVNSKQDNLIKKEVLNGYVFSNNFDKIIKKLSISNGTDYYKYIGYTNENVNKINSIVRYKLYGDNPPKIIEGETMIFDTPYAQTYSTNEEITVKNSRIVDKYVTYFDTVYNLKYYIINANYIDKDVYIGGIKVIHEDSEKDFKTIKKKIKEAIKKCEMTWVDYYKFIEQFAQLKYNHAITCHKSQGSTYQNVILNINDFKKCKGNEYYHLLYTGITRASNMVILYNT